MNYSNTIQKTYSPIEEQLNVISHCVGMIAATVGLTFLLMRVEGIYGLFACLVYGLSMILMFLSSTLYHWTQSADLKALLKVVDHSAIYLLIAGTYTPFMVLAIGGWVGLSGMIIVWSIALVGITCKIFANQRFPKLSVITYLLMGWIAIFFIYPLYHALSTEGLWLLVAGGLCYTVGVLFYVAKKIQFTHATWHVFVVAGCMCHFFSIYYYVI
ncbi:hemolysin III family protein [Paraglaciecola sp. MB-3u-78]|uniref:PAQR family membrane homeostasis protein TrhA n=1 Tax=Paraglaciecola sp. MB-3u-78 TaxID=2058332 RepID=UPI000C326BC0|nr:hemolysin III family protein [Paraglaciecola sp. MB-3u-78]PKG93412.1 hemolysin III family protein [Paraglaciecola sp. MB-3u-78]